MNGTVHMTPATNGPRSSADYFENEAKMLQFQYIWSCRTTWLFRHN